MNRSDTRNSGQRECTTFNEVNRDFQSAAWLVFTQSVCLKNLASSSLICYTFLYFISEMLTRIKRERLAKLRGEKPPDIVKAITKVLEETQKSAVQLQSPWVVEKFVRASLAEKKPGDIAAVLHGVKKKLERASHLPEQVLFTLDALLEGVVKEFVLKGLASMVTVTIEKALELVRIKLREPHSMEDKHHHLKQRRRTSDTERSHSKLSVRSLSRSSQEREKSDSLLQVLRGVSFGSATAIGRSSLVDVKGPFRSSRDRPPTPVPSVEHLAQEVFKDPPEEEEEDESEIKGKPDYHKLKLERQFAALSRRLIKSVVNKIEACDLRRKIMKPPLPVQFFSDDCFDTLMLSNSLHVVRRIYSKL
ncbi:uncharacterized protein LOC126188366 [Schistocerca cancellata]|uniref:uncharacterized protein LOC126188366 n=1 Tax=Schistocerca cancellata TaxID=274614 RepID=UPI00211971C5|nr:uncharacterized protein LOC126188366 [Schistocerca cancellata]